MSFYVAEVGRVKVKQDLVDQLGMITIKKIFFSERFWVFPDMYT